VADAVYLTYFHLLPAPSSVHRRSPCDKINADMEIKPLNVLKLGSTSLVRIEAHDLLARRVARLNAATNARLISKSLQKIDKLVTC